MVTVPHIMVGLERMLDYRGVEIVRFHCTVKRLWDAMGSISWTGSFFSSSAYHQPENDAP